MKLKIAFVGASLVAFTGILLGGCGRDACETAVDDTFAKQMTCPEPMKPVDASSMEAPATQGECTDALAKDWTCLAACYKAAPCECLALDKSKTCLAADAKKYIDCVSKCDITIR